MTRTHVLSAVLALAACDPSLPDGGTPDAIPTATPSPLASPVVLDLIVLLDGSESAAPVRPPLREALLDTATALVADGGSLRIGVTSLDAGDGSATPGTGGLFTGGCDAGWASSDDPDFGARLQALLALSTGGGDEQGLDSGVRALCATLDADAWDAVLALPTASELRTACARVPEAARTCHAGFRRPDAALALVSLSDEGDAAAFDAELPGTATRDACAAAGVDELSCAVDAWAGMLAQFDARWVTIGPSYQSPEDPIVGCDGAPRSVPGPCNEAGSSPRAMDLPQRVACETGGDWRPLQARDGASCAPPDPAALATLLTATLAAP